MTQTRGDGPASIDCKDEVGYRGVAVSDPGAMVAVLMASLLIRSTGASNFKIAREDSVFYAGVTRGFLRCLAQLEFLPLGQLIR